MTTTETINTEADVRAWFDTLLAMGINFHPDTRRDDYATPDAIPADYDARMARCFAVLSAWPSVYNVACEAFGAFYSRPEPEPERVLYDDHHWRVTVCPDEPTERVHVTTRRNLAPFPKCWHVSALAAAALAFTSALAVGGPVRGGA